MRRFVKGVAGRLFRHPQSYLHSIIVADQSGHCGKGAAVSSKQGTSCTDDGKQFVGIKEQTDARGGRSHGGCLIEKPKRFCDLEEFDNILKKYNLAKQGWFYYSALLKKYLGDNWQEDYLC